MPRAVATLSAICKSLIQALNHYSFNSSLVRRSSVSDVELSLGRIINSVRHINLEPDIVTGISPAVRIKHHLSCAARGCQIVVIPQRSAKICTRIGKIRVERSPADFFNTAKSELVLRGRSSSHKNNGSAAINRVNCFIHVHAHCRCVSQCNRGYRA